ncbi:hypothetical protein M501DRAFT_1017105 [Patellaria atrata CBS 101060]|uniref:RING-type domain-containing protein n=1 Tax=Patellaria atrata CBS 101060 TaxID=1346257 RepID=A0A9P4S8K6_9PEZI|nr:hypothetical protein M501DRAFT_1017105 [Patellaria atrata CBS 101060]
MERYNDHSHRGSSTLPFYASRSPSVTGTSRLMPESRPPQHSFRLQLPPLPGQPSYRDQPLPFQSHENSGFNMENTRPPTAQSGVEAATIIDLTSDSEDQPESIRTPSISRGNHFARVPGLPRYHREIIDLSEDTPPNRAPSEAEPQQIPPSSPDIQFIASRPRSVPRNNPREDHFMFTFPNDDDDNDLEGLVGNIGHGYANRNGGGLPTGFDARTVYDRSVRMSRLVQRLNGRARHGRTHRHRDTGPVGITGFGHNFPIFAPPPNLDMTLVGFDMGLRSPSPPPLHTYDTPSAAPDGFTRSPEETDVLICPNCSDELCTGDSDLKKQVWISKTCGHVYCGECTQNRFTSNRTKRKGKQPASMAPAFKACVVVGCDKMLSRKSQMIQLFL